MTTAYKSIFDSADWIAALDRQLAAPPDPPPAGGEPTAEAFTDPLPTWDTEPAADRRSWRPATWLLFGVIVALLFGLCWLAMIAIYGGDTRLAAWVMTQRLLPALALEIVVIVVLAWRTGNL